MSKINVIGKQNKQSGSQMRSLRNTRRHTHNIRVMTEGATSVLLNKLIMLLNIFLFPKISKNTILFFWQSLYSKRNKPKIFVTPYGIYKLIPNLLTPVELFFLNCLQSCGFTKKTYKTLNRESSKKILTFLPKFLPINFVGLGCSWM